VQTLSANKQPVFQPKEFLRMGHLENTEGI